MQAETERYRAQLAEVESPQRQYLDETGSTLNMTPTFGRSPQGQRAHDTKPVSPGESVSTIALLSEQGLSAQYTYSGPLTAERFKAYLETYVQPHWSPGQTLILDRHPVHCAKIVQAYLKNHDIPFIYLPTYSPELNPIEEGFSKFKQFVKKQKARTIETLREVLYMASDLITPTDAKHYIAHADEILSN